MSTTPYWVTAVTSGLSALLGGGIGAWSAHHVMKSTQQDERRARVKEKREEAASQLTGAFMRVKSEALDDTGARKATPEAEAALRDLQRTLTVSTPALSGLGLEQRLSDGLEFAMIKDESIQLTAVPQDKRTAVLIRVHADRRALIDWVVASLQDVACGDRPPAPARAPAGLDQEDAEAWARPVPAKPLTRAQRLRRTFSKSTDG